MKFLISAIHIVAVLFIIISGTTGQRRGEQCRFGKDQQIGRCLLLSRCPFAMQQIYQNIHPLPCDFEGFEPVVCCPDTGTAEKLSRSDVPIPPGTKSEEKCREYSNVLQINEKSHAYSIGGVQASAKEFPHMAALGFGEENDIQWQCGGTLISREFVLTAAHCLYSQELAELKYVRLGDLNLKSESDDADPQTFRVGAAYRNPKYRPPARYNDIALVRLDRPVNITPYVKPACLYTKQDLPENSTLTATGWGRRGFAGGTSSKLMKVDLSYFTNDQCRLVYANVPQRSLSNGIVDDMQLCAGGINASRDTCQGDSGGPLQIRDFYNPKQFYVIGVTSFGKNCGIKNIPGVYTRVSNYISWIEETIWPDLWK